MLISSKLRPEKVVQVFKPLFLSQLFSFLLVHQIFTSWPSSIFPLHPRLHTDFCIYLHKHQKQERFYLKEDLLIETKSFSLKLLDQRMWLKSTRTKIRQMFLQNFDILNVNTILWIFYVYKQNLRILLFLLWFDDTMLISMYEWYNGNRQRERSLGSGGGEKTTLKTSKYL